MAHPSSSTFFFHAFSLRAIYTCLDCLTCTKTYALHFLSCGFITCQLYMRQTVRLAPKHVQVHFTIIMHLHYLPIIHASDHLTRTKTCATALYNYHAFSLHANYTCVRPSDLHQNICIYTYFNLTSSFQSHHKSRDFTLFYNYSRISHERTNWDPAFCPVERGCPL